MSAPSRKSTSCCAGSPTQGAAIVFYSTDYDELIGCCDRVLVLYDGAIKRELAGAEITERALIASALNIDVGTKPRSRSAGAMSDWRYLARRAPRDAARVRRSSS